MKGHRFNKILSKAFGLLIWKVVPLNDSILALELRLEEKLEVEFLVVSLEHRKISKIKNKKINWWTNIEGGHGDHIQLQQFEHENDPSSKKSLQINWRTNKLSKTPIKDDEPTPQYFPVFYPKDHEGFIDISSFLATLSITHHHAIEYLEYEYLIIITYYQGQSNLKRKILALDKDGEELLHDQIDSNMKGIVFQSFFTFGRYLVYVKERKTLEVFYI